MLRRMARYAVDARALLHIASTGVRIHPDHQLVAPNSVRSEALSLLYDQGRRGELAEDEALRLHERLTEVKIRLLGDRVSRRTAWRASLARRATGIVPMASPDALASAPGA